MGLFSWLGKLFGSRSQPLQRVVFKSPAQRSAPTSQAPGFQLEGESLSQPSSQTPLAQPKSAGGPQRPQQKAPRKLNLDPGQFAPLSGDQLKRRSLLVG